MTPTVATRTTVLLGALGLAVLAGCSDQPTQPKAAPELGVRASAGSSALAARVANIDPRYLSGGAYALFYGHLTAGIGSTIFSEGPQSAKAFTDVLVNNRTVVPPCTASSCIGQSETAIAVNGRNVVAGWNDSRGFTVFNDGLSGWGLSTDGGKTWLDGGGLPRIATANFQHSGDPGIVVSAAGTYFYTDLCEDGSLSGICVTKGTVSGGTVAWGTPQYAINSSVNFMDKCFAAVSSSGTDVYVTYTRFGSNGQIEIVASHDGGVTYGTPVVLAAEGALVNQGSMPAIGPAGEVYVTWEQGWLNTTTPSLKLRKSTDGGATFGSTVNVATIGSLAFTSIPGYNRANMNDFPRIAVATSGTGSGNIYVIYHSLVSGNAQVFSARSTNGGTSFTAGVQMNDDATSALQFLPNVAVEANGMVHASWYDRRLNPGTALTDTFWSGSTDGGVTFLTNVRVSSVTTNWSTTNTDITPNFGDYNSIAASASGVNSFGFAVWGDGRLGDPDVFFAKIGHRP